MDQDDCYLTGVCFLDLVDFDHDGIKELYLVYGVPTQYWWYRYQYVIYGYDTKSKKAKKIDSGEVGGEEQNLELNLHITERTKSTNYFILHSESSNHTLYTKIRTVKNNKPKTLKTFSYSQPKDICYIDGKKVFFMLPHLLMESLRNARLR